MSKHSIDDLRKRFLGGDASKPENGSGAAPETDLEQKSKPRIKPGAEKFKRQIESGAIKVPPPGMGAEALRRFEPGRTAVAPHDFYLTNSTVLGIVVLCRKDIMRRECTVVDIGFERGWHPKGKFSGVSLMQIVGGASTFQRVIEALNVIEERLLEIEKGGAGGFFFHIVLEMVRGVRQNGVEVECHVDSRMPQESSWQERNGQWETDDAFAERLARKTPLTFKEATDALASTGKVGAELAGAMKAVGGDVAALAGAFGLPKDMLGKGSK